ncbi:hypothetical protein Hypma_015411 [Hypsizygus marmoreus]|uniref:Uncharacterized protein n=1 Tax=Hypsizygus marmoreus TaxID=39966 RepID=A0A369K8L3_HYPMA|nr:hypothetical protein Hypma_015411 [Hypsizygus marmoreus]
MISSSSNARNWLADEYGVSEETIDKTDILVTQLRLFLPFLLFCNLGQVSKDVGSKQDYSGKSIHVCPRTWQARTHFSETAAVVGVLLLLRGRLLTQTCICSLPLLVATSLGGLEVCLRDKTRADSACREGGDEGFFHSRMVTGVTCGDEVTELLDASSRDEQATRYTTPPGITSKLYRPRRPARCTALPHVCLFPSAASLPPTYFQSAQQLHPTPASSDIDPWARDEPPSPKDQPSESIIDSHHATESRPSDVTSYNTSTTDLTSRWWTFTLPRPGRSHHYTDVSSPTTSRPERKGLRDLSMSWLPTTASLREASFSRRDREKDAETAHHDSGMNRNWDLSISLPSPPAAPYTLAHNVTPGWDSPWSPRVAAQGPPGHNLDSSYGLEEHESRSDDSHKDLSTWQRRRRNFRTFILTNTYVPLLFRFINITFTTAALAVAIHIRRMEITGHAMGAVGSSPTVVIIFAPLTLVHVMIALEYFGRPLGLWRTSGKLTHTLSEVLFICAWSAALSLCFDNFFTSLVPCASPSSMSWYNELPRPPSIVPNFEGGLGDRICDNQLALICLVGIGLLAYCTNLIISLFRIFEKVKYHPAARLRT